MSLFGIPKYCKKCGEEIVYEQSEFRFNKKTGVPTKLLHDWRCPNLRAYGMDLNGHYWKQRVRRPRNSDYGIKESR